MKLLLCIALCFLVAQGSALKPMVREFPAWSLNPRHTGAKWQAILANNQPTKEVLADFRPGTIRQIESAGAIRPGSGSGDKIIGGADASSGQFPWQVSNSMDNSYFCGGSIISSTWVLTAGHCVEGFNTFRIGFGSLSPNGGGAGSSFQTSRSAILHEGYNGETFKNDIALIELPTELTWSPTVGPVRLPRHSQEGLLFEGEVFRVSGWGRTSDSSSSIAPTLKYVDLDVIPNPDCAAVYGDIVTDSNVCVNGGTKRATCNGDSGGPVVWQESDGRYTEVGLVSFGAALGCELGFPDAFTRVTSFLLWIENNSGLIIED